MKKKEAIITVYPFNQKWRIKINYPFKTDGGETIFESSMAGRETLSEAKRLAGRIKKIHEEKGIPIIIKVVRESRLLPNRRETS